MHKGDLIITNKTRRRVVKSMQVLLEERSKAYFNFIQFPEASHDIWSILFYFVQNSLRHH